MMIYCVIVLLLTVLYVIIFLLYIAGWVTLPVYSSGSPIGNTRVSIIIPVRNEEQHITNLLLDLARQDYPASLFEIIVVDDFSNDGTVSILKSFTAHPVTVLQLKDVIADESSARSFKKKALEYGIERASGELIVTTDGDCRMNSEWLSTIVNFYEHKNCHMVVGPVAFTGETSFFERLQSLDFLGLIGITGATLQLNFPVMCNGANVAFRKKSFKEVNGYEGIDQTASGDDVLLMHKISRRWKTGVRFLKSEKAVVYTFAQRNLKAFMQQRIRWASKSKYYTDRLITINLIVVYLFNVAVIVSALLCFFNTVYCFVLAVQLILKMIVEFSFLSVVTGFFKRRKLLTLFLPAQVFHILYIVVIGTFGNTVKTTWKGRRIS